MSAQFRLARLRNARSTHNRERQGVATPEEVFKDSRFGGRCHAGPPDAMGEQSPTPSSPVFSTPHPQHAPASAAPQDPGDAVDQTNRVWADWCSVHDKKRSPNNLIRDMVTLRWVCKRGHTCKGGYKGWAAAADPSLPDSGACKRAAPTARPCDIHREGRAAAACSPAVDSPPQQHTMDEGVLAATATAADIMRTEGDAEGEMPLAHLGTQLFSRLPAAKELVTSKYGRGYAGLQAFFRSNDAFFCVETKDGIRVRLKNTAQAAGTGPDVLGTAEREKAEEGIASKREMDNLDYKLDLSSLHASEREAPSKRKHELRRHEEQEQGRQEQQKQRAAAAAAAATQREEEESRRKEELQRNHEEQEQRAKAEAAAQQERMVLEAASVAAELARADEAAQKERRNAAMRAEDAKRAAKRKAKEGKKEEQRQRRATDSAAQSMADSLCDEFVRACATLLAEEVVAEEVVAEEVVAEEVVADCASRKIALEQTAQKRGAKSKRYLCVCVCVYCVCVYIYM